MPDDKIKEVIEDLDHAWKSTQARIQVNPNADERVGLAVRADTLKEVIGILEDKLIVCSQCGEGDLTNITWLPSGGQLCPDCKSNLYN